MKTRQSQDQEEGEHDGPRSTSIFLLTSTNFQYFHPFKLRFLIWSQNICKEDPLEH